MANKIKVTIEEDGVEPIIYDSNDDGEQTSEDIISEITSIVGERPMRKRTRR